MSLSDSLLLPVCADELKGRTLGCKPWAEAWLAEQLVGKEADGVRITKLNAVDGDCELGSRKGK